MSIRVQALPELVDKWNALDAAARAEGIDIVIADFGGFRTAADTAEILRYKQLDYAAYAAGARARGNAVLSIDGPWDDGNSRPIAPYGQSKHDFGGARDFTIVSRPAGMSLEDATARVQAIAEGFGLVSGASFGDPPHLELPYSLDELAQQWADYSSSSSSGPGLEVLLTLLAVGVGAWTVVRYAHAIRAL